MVATDKQQTNDEQLLQMAVKAAKSGQKEGARMMLQQVYNNNRRNETAMMWLVKLSRTQNERREWLERILEINPDHEAAQKALRSMEYKRKASDNRTLLLLGGVAFVMVVLAVVLLVVVSL